MDQSDGPGEISVSVNGKGKPNLLNCPPCEICGGSATLRRNQCCKRFYARWHGKNVRRAKDKHERTRMDVPKGIGLLDPNYAPLEGFNNIQLRRLRFATINE